MNDPELKALNEIAKALADLSEEQRRNVLLYVNSRYGAQVHVSRAVARAVATMGRNAGTSDVEPYGNIGDLFDAANPQTEAERVLVVAYWIQVVEDAEDFESFPVNNHLKQLGHPVSNITRALDSMIDQTPRLVLQTSKSGSAKQARKRYKITREGIKRVQSMLASKSGDRDES